MGENTRPLREFGETGLSHFSGIIQDEFLAELRISGNAGGFKVYDEMRRNSPVVGALLNSIQQAVLGVDWYVRSDTENDARVDFVNEALEGLEFSLQDHFTEALTMLPFGFSLFEVVYKRDGSRLVWDKLAFRGQDTVYRWEIDTKKRKGKILGFWQQGVASWTPVKIPIEKCVHYRTSVERNNPEGISILRSAYIPYYYAKNMQAIEAIGIERDLVGLPIVKLGPDASADPNSKDYLEAEEMVRRVRADEQGGIVLPNSYEFRLASADSSRLNEPGAVIARHEKRMLMSSLAQFLVLGMDGVGALSLSQDQTDFFNMSVNTFADRLANTFTKQAIRKLLLLNGMEPSGVFLEHSPAGDTNIELYTKALQQASTFLTWTNDDEVFLRSLLKLPEKTVEELEQAKEDERERQESLFAPRPTGAFGQPPTPAPEADADEQEDVEDEMSVDHFGAVELAHENSFEKRLNWFFGKQKGDVKREAKNQRGV